MTTSLTFEAFQDLVWERFKTVAHTHGATTFEQSDLVYQEIYKNMPTTGGNDGLTWIEVFDLNYHESIKKYDPCSTNPDDQAHYQDRYYVCAEVAARISAREAAGEPVSIRDFMRALVRTQNVASRPGLRNNMCG